MQRVNLIFKRNMEARMAQRLSIDETVTANIHAKWLVGELCSQGFMFKVHNVGAGVKRITTNTETCPCCKKPL